MTKAYAQTVGIAVDHRRSNKSAESLDLNVNRLKEYSSRLVLIPRRHQASKASQEDIANAKQLTGEIVAAPAAAPAVTYAPLSDVRVV